MMPPGWRPPGVPDPRLKAYGGSADGAELGPSVPGSEPTLPTRRLAELSPPLWPGLHLVFGTHGSGTSQLGVQAAVESALRGISVALHHPQTDRHEAALRVAAILSGVAFGQLAGRPPEELERALDRLDGAPFALTAFEPERADPVDPLSVPARLLVLDPAPTGPDLVALRQRAIARRVAVLAIAASVSLRPPSEREREMQLTLPDSDVALADQVFVVIPDAGPRVSGAPHPTRVGVAKSRRGVPGWARLTFDGALFAEEPDELELSLDEPEEV